MNKIPETMRAAAIDRFGGPEVLTVHTLPVPEIDDNEVLIAVHTAGVGRWDADMRAGWLPDGEQPHFPLVLGTDGSGHVAKVGSRIRRFKVGEEVYSYSFANPKGGFYAEYVAVVAEKVAHTPNGLDLEHAGAIGTIGLTALQGIDDALHLKKGESVIIHGASGGLGTLAVQFAKLRGARVLGTASGDDGMNLVRTLGADVAVDGKREDVTAAARNFAPDGVDAILATVGGDSLERCIDAAKRGGRVAYPNGVEPTPKKRPGIKFVAYDGTPGVREFEHLNKAIEEAKLQVPIAAAFKLEQAAKAHERLAQGHVLGKIVLRIR
ncbi:MAG: NADPH:quinone reductase [Candidatus Angelobacter sp.]|jgi:NADPH2:quinone reductase|nr:NADPH:quinone reductase [Candidatus Angelobacter sp.]